MSTVATKASFLPNTPAAKIREELERRGWKDQGLGTVGKWEEGVSVIGRFVRFKDGKFGEKGLVILDVDGEKQTWSAPVILRDRLESCEMGDTLFIECTGEIETQGGNTALAFVVLRAPREGV
jgi:hypothetical protein